MNQNLWQWYPESFGHQISADRQNGIIRTVVTVIEGLEVFNLYVFDIATVTDGTLSIVMPIVKNRLHTLHHDAIRRIFSHLIFIAHHGHFRVQVLTSNVGVAHCISTPTQGPVQIIFRCCKSHVVIGSVQPCRTIHSESTAGKFFGRIRIILTSLKHQMLKKVSHTGFAVILMTRADQIGHIDRWP